MKRVKISSLVVWMGLKMKGLKLLGMKLKWGAVGTIIWNLHSGSNNISNSKPEINAIHANIPPQKKTHERNETINVVRMLNNGKTADVNRAIKEMLNMCGLLVE